MIINSLFWNVRNFSLKKKTNLNNSINSCNEQKYTTSNISFTGFADLLKYNSLRHSMMSFKNIIKQDGEIDFLEKYPQQANNYISNVLKLSPDLSSYQEQVDDI